MTTGNRLGPGATPTIAPVATVGATPLPAAPTPLVVADQQPRRGGTLVVATGLDPGQLNPGITTAGGTHFVAGNIFNGLLQLDEQFNPEPDFAESWTVSPDGRAYTFKLRTGVTWHDGQPFSSADVKFTFDEVLLKYHARTKAGLEGVLDGIDTPDASTVVMRFKQPYGPLLQRLDASEAPILPRHIYAGSDVQNNPANLRPVGTGPFKFAEYQKGESVRLVRNEHYFKPGLPYLDELIFKVIPQASTATLALEHGEVDYLLAPAEADVAHLRQNAGIVVATSAGSAGGSNCQDTLIFNLRRPLFDKIEVRQAFAYAIDRQQILDQVKFGLGKVAASPISSALAWAHNAGVPQYPQDLARANQLLDQAGYARGPGGTRLKVSFPHASMYAKIGDVVRQDLAEVGVDVDAQPLEFNTANETVFIKQDFDLGMGGYCNGPDPEIGVTRAYVSSNIKPIPFGNGAAYSNPRVDELFAQAAATVDRQERATLYGEIQDILVREVPYWWLVEDVQIRAYKQGLRDPTIWRGDLAERAWWEKAL